MGKYSPINYEGNGSVGNPAPPGKRASVTFSGTIVGIDTIEGTRSQNPPFVFTVQRDGGVGAGKTTTVYSGGSWAINILPNMRYEFSCKVSGRYAAFTTSKEPTQLSQPASLSCG